MKIKIDDVFHIEVDAYNYTLKERIGKDKKGNDTFRPHGYFRGVDRVLQYLSKELVSRIDKEVTLDEYIKELDTVTDKLRDLVKGDNQ